MSETFAHAPAFARHFSVFSGAARLLAILYEADGELVSQEALRQRLGAAKATIYAHTTRLHEAMEAGAFYAVSRHGYRLTEKGMAQCAVAIASVGPAPAPRQPRKRSGKPEVRDPFWTDERVEALKVLWKEGRSAAQIAKEICAVSRSAVLGKANRLGIGGRSKPSAPKLKAPPVKRNLKASTNVAKGFAKSKRTKPEKPKLVIAGNNAVMVCPPAQEPREDTKRDAFAPLPGSQPQPFTERRFNQCSWPVSGEGADTLSCCNPVHKRGWCSQHYAIGCQPLANAAKWDKALKVPKTRRAA